jgi:ABC-2 type transport system permease protein
MSAVIEPGAGRDALLAPGSGRAAPLGRMIAAQLAMELRLTARRGENLLATLVLPALLLVFFAAVPLLPSGSAVPGSRPVEGLLPGVLAIAIVAAGLVNLGIATAFERGYGVLKRLGGSPLPRGGLLAAKIGAVVVVEVAQATLLLAIAAGAFGWAPGPSWSLPLVAVTVTLGTAAFAATGLLLAGALRAEATLAVANGLFVLGMLLGGLLVPASELPGLLGDVAALTPTAALADALRIGLGVATGDAATALVLLGGWGVAAAAAAARLFRWE